MQHATRLRISLLMLRISVFVVMLMWTLDKFILPEHAAGVYATFYNLQGIEGIIMMLIGGIELVIIIGFVLGVFKRVTYGIVLIIHAISTFATFNQYLTPYEGPNLLFFAAWPMLAACITLYLMRDTDTLLAFGKRKSI